MKKNQPNKISNAYAIKRIIYCFFINILILFLLVVSLFVENEELSLDTKYLVIILIATCILFILECIYFILRQKSYSFIINDNECSLFFGVIFKNKRSMSYDKIQNITLKRSIIDYIFNTATLQIDSGAMVTSILPEINILLSVDDAEKLKYFFDNKKKNIDIDFDSKEEKNALNNEIDLKYKPRILMKSICCLLVEVIFYIIIFCAYLIGNYFSEEVKFLWAFLIGLFVFIGLICLSFGFTFLVLKLQYYNFIIKEDTDSIYISYGLIQQIKYVVPKKCINGYTIKQGVFGRLFGYGSTELKVIGLGDIDSNGNKRDTCIFPYSKINIMKEYIREKLDQKIEDGIFRKEKYQRVNFMLYPSLLLLFIYFVIALPVMIIFPVVMKYGIIFYVPIFISAIISLLGFFRYKTQYCGIYDKYIVITNGCLFKTESYIFIDKIQKISAKKGPILRIEGICNYKIEYKTSIISGEMLLSYPENIFYEIDDVIGK